ncbi:MAG: hypothetical protein AAGD04_16460 [Pseudomonadota bacterium]
MKKWAMLALASGVALSAPSVEASESGFWRLFVKSDRSTSPTRVGSNIMPPADFLGQRWVHPNGCQYSRAGRPGETVWFLVATGAKGCAAYIVQQSPYASPY